MPNQKNQMNHSLDGLYIGIDPDLSETASQSGIASTKY
jgi:hypothetical protein